MAKQSFEENTFSEIDEVRIPLARNEVKIVKDGVKNEAVRDLIRGLSSTASLPGYLKGEVYSSQKGVLIQCLAAGAVLILVAGIGAPIGYSATTLPQLQKENGSMKADEEMGSWIASIHSIATPVGSAVSGSLMEALGRRRTLIAAILPLIIGWVVISTSQNLIQLLIGRFVCGLSVGIVAAPTQVYLGEISEPKLRGLLIGAPVCAYALGILYINGLGGVMNWRKVALASIGLPLLSLIALIFSPESPTWLARRERLSSAAGSIAKLRGNKEVSKRELYQIISAHEKAKSGGETKLPFFKSVTKASALKPLLLLIATIVLQSFTGTYLIIFYALDMLEATGSSVDPTWAVITSALVRTIVSLITCVLLLKLSRRTLFLTACGCTSVIAVILVAYVYISKLIGKSNPQIVLILFILYIAANTVGYMALPILMTAELLPVHVRGLCGAYIFSFMNIFIFGVTKCYPNMKYAFGIEGLFVVFMISSILGTLLIYFMLPETKDRTLIDIERYFQGPNIMWTTRNRFPEPNSVLDT